jgi:hypothetical protein
MDHPVSRAIVSYCSSGSLGVSRPDGLRVLNPRSSLDNWLVGESRSVSAWRPRTPQPPLLAGLFSRWIIDQSGVYNPSNREERGLRTLRPSGRMGPRLPDEPIKHAASRTCTDISGVKGEGRGSDSRAPNGILLLDDGCSDSGTRSSHRAAVRCAVRECRGEDSNLHGHTATRLTAKYEDQTVGPLLLARLPISPTLHCRPLIARISGDRSGGSCTHVTGI